MNPDLGRVAPALPANHQGWTGPGGRPSGACHTGHQAGTSERLQDVTDESRCRQYCAQRSGCAAYEFGRRSFSGAKTFTCELHSIVPTHSVPIQGYTAVCKVKLRTSPFPPLVQSPLVHGACSAHLGTDVPRPVCARGSRNYWAAPRNARFLHSKSDGHVNEELGKHDTWLPVTRTTDEWSWYERTRLRCMWW